MRRLIVYTWWGVTQFMLRTAVHTESKRDSPRFDWLTVFFVCDADETLVCINGTNCSAKHALFLLSCSYLLLRRVLLHCCARYVCHHHAVYVRIICSVCRLWYALVFFVLHQFWHQTDQVYLILPIFFFCVCLGISTYSIDNGCIRTASDRTMRYHNWSVV